MEFQEDFFRTLNNWQKGWAEKQALKNEYGEKLKSECLKLPDKYRIVKNTCYRKRFIHSGELFDIIYNNEKNEGITSWTTDFRYAEIFKDKFRENAISAAIFEHKPNKEEVILNIEELWKCDDFIKQLDVFCNKNPKDCKAINNFKNLQKEIILETPLRGNQIVALTGKSSSFDDLCDEANIPEEKRPEHFKRLIDNGAYIEEVTFIRGKSAQRAIKKTLKNFRELINQKQ